MKALAHAGRADIALSRHLRLLSGGDYLCTDDADSDTEDLARHPIEEAQKTAAKQNRLCTYSTELSYSLLIALCEKDEWNAVLQVRRKLCTINRIYFFSIRID